MRTQEKDLENGGSDKVGTDAAGMRELSDDKSRRFRAGRGIFQLEVLAMEQVTALSTPTIICGSFMSYTCHLEEKLVALSCSIGGSQLKFLFLKNVRITRLAELLFYLKKKKKRKEKQRYMLGAHQFTKISKDFV